MKKILIFTLFIVLSIVLISCTQQKQINNETNSETTLSTEKITTVDTDSNIEDILDKYVSMYNATHVYKDILNPISYLLISDNKIISILAIPEVTNTIIIDIPVERTETNNVANMYVLKFYDRTGQSISFTTNESGYTEIIGLLNK